MTNTYVDAANTTVTAQTLTYKGTNIRFQHFLWQVKQESVCADLKQQATPYSECTQQARAMFSDLCNLLSSMNNLNPKGRSLSRMYCKASLNYKSMIATISKPARKTKQQLKEKECNQYILKAMQDSRQEIAKRRDKVCAEGK
ncbi:hypothetical protein [Shewanella baltica]|uniref:hypothetical protein n=1 Tax=Shewanella baltica TaxID=62322 RepID=UPI00217D9374|nr:hypothetical protein [Shewanella baltica]MCS6191535.1 hypothetical protein [Shewanella baltica]